MQFPNLSTNPSSNFKIQEIMRQGSPLIRKTATKLISITMEARKWWGLTSSISPFHLAEAMKDLPPIFPVMLMNWAQNAAPLPNTSLWNCWRWKIANKVKSSQFCKEIQIDLCCFFTNYKFFVGQLSRKLIIHGPP